MNLLSIHPFVKYKQFLMDLQRTLVTDSLLAAGMITYSLASTRRLRCLQCAIPKTWYFAEDQIFRSVQFSSKQQNNWPELRASKPEPDLC